MYYTECIIWGWGTREGMTAVSAAAATAGTRQGDGLPHRVRLSLGTAYFGIHGDFMGVKIEVIEGLSQKTH